MVVRRLAGSRPGFEPGSTPHRKSTHRADIYGEMEMGENKLDRFLKHRFLTQAIWFGDWAHTFALCVMAEPVIHANCFSQQVLICLFRWYLVDILVGSLLYRTMQLHVQSIKRNLFFNQCRPMLPELSDKFILTSQFLLSKQCSNVICE